MTKAIDKAIADVLTGMDAPLPKACHRTTACAMAGGCMVCFADLLTDARRLRRVEREWFEEARDRELDMEVFGTRLPKGTIQ